MMSLHPFDRSGNSLEGRARMMALRVLDRFDNPTTPESRGSFKP